MVKRSFLRNHFRSVVTAACTFALVAAFAGAAKPMTVSWDGNTGRVIKQEIFNQSAVDTCGAAALWHITKLNDVGIKRMNNYEPPCRWNGGIGSIDVYWW